MIGDTWLKAIFQLVTIVLVMAAFPCAESQIGRGGGSFSESISDQAARYLSDSAKWKWPVANHSQSEIIVHGVLASWCGRVYEDTIREASAKVRQFEQLKAEGEQRFEELTRCLQERKAREKELETECERRRQLLLSSLDFDRIVLKAECVAETEMAKADLEACELKLRTKERVMCVREVEMEKGACSQAMEALKANVTACRSKHKVSDPSRLLSLKETAENLIRDRAAWAVEKTRLLQGLANCRPARAHKEALLKEVMADKTTEELERTVVWLQLLLFLALLLLIAAVTTASVLSLKERNLGTGDYGWVSVKPPGRLRLVTADRGKDMLEDAFEGRRKSRLPLVLATATNPDNDGPPATVFFLIPVNIVSSRRFSLFNSTGDYVKHTERAQEIVSKALPKARLIVVLYDSSGTVFTEETFQSLGLLNADKVAYEAIPKDMDFPKSQNLVALWLDKVEGLRASDSERESDLTQLIRIQPWAQFLLGRSGRWGQAHAKL